MGTCIWCGHPAEAASAYSESLRETLADACSACLWTWEREGLRRMSRNLRIGDTWEALALPGNRYTWRLHTAPRRGAGAGPWVYFVGWDPAQPFKIGFANDVQGRLASLQTGNPYRLTVFGAIRALRGVHESWLHALCGEQRLEGEWFKPEGRAGDTLAVVMAATAVLDEPPLADWLASERTAKKDTPIPRG